MLIAQRYLALPVGIESLLDGEYLKHSQHLFMRAEDRKLTIAVLVGM